MPEVTDPNLLAKLNGGAAPAGSGPQPVLSIPDRPEKPTEPKTTWRTMTPAEARAQGLPENGVYQVSSQGEIRAVKTPPEKTDPSTPQGRRDIALSVLGAAGIDLRGGKDPVADLIRGSTSGGLQTWAARKYGSITGSATDGMMKIAQLETIGNDLVLKASGGSLGAQISNSDREFMAARFGDIANPEKTVDERLAAWEQVKQRLGYDAGIEMGYPTGQPGTIAPPGGGPGGTVNPTMRGGLPVGTDITFDGQGGPQWWDRNQWLMETHGITPDQESQIVGFWNANRGNQGITLEGVYAWHDRMGIQRPSEQEVMQGVQRARAGNVEFGAFDDSDAKAARAAQLQGMVQQDSAVRNFGAEYDPNSARSYLDTLTEAPLAGFADELSGLSGAIVGGLSGENPVTAYRDARDASQFRDEMNRNAQGIPGEALRLVGSLPTAMSLPGAYSPTVGGAVKAGASYGALAGAGEGRGLEGTIKGAAGGAALGGAVGGATAGAGQWAVNKLAARAEGRALQPVTDGQNVISAAGRLNEQFGTKIKPIPGMVGGDGTRSITAPWRKAPIGGTLINRGLNKVTAGAEQARNSIRAIFGEAAEPEQAGEAVIGSLQNWLKTSKNRPQALFKQAEREAGDTVVDFANARAVADDLIAQAQKTPGGVAGLDDLIELRAALDSPSDVIAARAMRTEQKAKVKGKNLQYTPAEARILQVMDAADDDIVTSLRQAGKDDVAEKFNQAAQEWRERSLTIDEVVVPILGRRNDLPKSGEEVISAIEQAAKRKSARLGKLMSILPEDDANALRATVLDRIGKATPGQQTGAMADDFSTETFLTQWNGMSDRAKTAMFGGELRAALDDVATVAGAVRKVNKVGTNPSGAAVLSGLSGMTLTAGAAINPLFLLFNAIDGIGGAVLASPRFARWMAKMPKEPGKARMHLEGLRKVAAAESGPISAELNSLYGTLAGQFDNLKGSAQPSFAQPGQEQDQARNTAKPTTMPVPK